MGQSPPLIYGSRRLWGQRRSALGCQHYSNLSTGFTHPGRHATAMRPVPPLLSPLVMVLFSCSSAGVSADSQTRRDRRSQVAAVSYRLYREKHVLRQMRGRRLDDHGAIAFHATSDPENPVVVDTWQTPSAGETEKQSLVRHLQVCIAEN